MQDLNDLFYFAQVVSHGGYAAAARAVGVQKSTLSRRIALLEERLGTALLYRTSRRIALTDIGRDYYRQCLVVLEDAEIAQRVIERTHEEPCSSIRIACPVGLLEYLLSDLLATFMIRFPKVEVHLKCLNRRVDVIGEGYDLAISEGADLYAQSTFTTRHLGSIARCLVASPGLFETYDQPAKPKDLAGLPGLVFGFPTIERAMGGPQPRHDWHLRDSRGKALRVQYTPRLVTDSLASLHAAARKGLGVAQLPQLLVRDDVAAGRLTPLLPAFRSDDHLLYATFPSTRALAPAVRILLEHLEDGVTLQT